jgi:hypothetical protein
MSDLHELELIRARWRRALELEALDRTDRDDFALGPLARRLRTCSTMVILQPADPEADIVRLDEEFWGWMEEHAARVVDGRYVRLGTQKYPTAQAAAIVSGYGAREPWNSYLAVHRSGAVELGLGDRGGWERRDREDNPVRLFNLISTVTYVWAMLAFVADLSERIALPGPWLVTVAARDTRDAQLGNVGEGWAEPGQHENHVGGCAEDHLLWHIQLSPPLDEDGQRQTALSVGDRFEDAWGIAQRRYLAHRGDRAGQLDHRHIAE